jgi:hypothetical protein
MRFNFSSPGPEIVATPIVAAKVNSHYTFRCPRCNKVFHYIAFKPYQKAMDRGHCRKCKHAGEWTCFRCKTTISYLSADAFLKPQCRLTHCSKCKNIPDWFLPRFWRGEKYRSDRHFPIQKLPFITGIGECI